MKNFEWKFVHFYKYVDEKERNMGAFCRRKWQARSLARVNPHQLFLSSKMPLVLEVLSNFLLSVGISSQRICICALPSPSSDIGSPVACAGLKEHFISFHPSTAI